MVNNENKVFIRRYFEAMSSKEKTAALLDTYIAETDAALKQHIAATESAFPGYELLIEEMIAEGNLVAVRAIFKGVHQGSMGDIPATGKAVRQPFIIIYRIGDGKIIEHWSSIDGLALMQQLGVLPTVGETA